MTFLQAMNASDATSVLSRSSERAAIGRALAELGIAYRHRTQADVELEGLRGGATAQGFAALRRELPIDVEYQCERIQVDARGADSGALSAFAQERRRYAREHTHPCDEMWYFIDGGAAFYLHAAGQVLALVCERGDFVRVPRGLPHWFDAGERPRYDGLHYVLSVSGFTGEFTGDEIATRFPPVEALLAQDQR